MGDDGDDTIERFKAIFGEVVEKIDKNFEEIFATRKKDKIIGIWEQQKSDYLNQIYNSYIYQILDNIHLMLKFKRVKIATKKIKMETYSRKNEAFMGLKAPKMPIRVNIGNITNMFQSKVEENHGEFGIYMKSIINLFQYDRFYEECRDHLNKLKEKNKKRREGKNNLSGTKLITKFIGFFTGGVQQLMFSVVQLKKATKEKKKKDAINLDFLSQDSSGNDIFLKQSEVMKKILQTFLSQEVMEVDTTIKMKILNILTYYLDYK